jgi:nitroimidazol reductase NimA-like FMN-containing flavoprotein (pyridoxamine 5'-phosphate oxidase superfamily)
MDNAQTISDSFPITARNRVKRLHERGSYDHASVYAVLDAGILCHVAYAIDGQPYCTPTIYWREGDVLYWHGSSASRMLRHFKPGTPACLTVSHLDGLVLARSGFNHSANYRSAMCFGTARIIDDPKEKAAALDGVVDRLYRGRSEDLRPITAQEVKATTVIGMRIDDASAKVRAKGVGDNEDDYDHPAWAGVIPVRTVIGDDEPCPRLLPGISRPGKLSAYSSGRTLDQALVEAQHLYESDVDRAIYQAPPI